MLQWHVEKHNVEAYRGFNLDVCIGVRSSKISIRAAHLPRRYTWYKVTSKKQLMSAVFFTNEFCVLNDAYSQKSHFLGRIVCEIVKSRGWSKEPSCSLWSIGCSLCFLHSHSTCGTCGKCQMDFFCELYDYLQILQCYFWSKGFLYR